MIAPVVVLGAMGAVHSTHRDNSPTHGMQRVQFSGGFSYEVGLSEWCHIWGSARSCGDCIWFGNSSQDMYFFLKY